MRWGRLWHDSIVVVGVHHHCTPQVTRRLGNEKLKIQVIKQEMGLKKNKQTGRVRSPSVSPFDSTRVESLCNKHPQVTHTTHTHTHTHTHTQLELLQAAAVLPHSRCSTSSASPSLRRHCRHTPKPLLQKQLPLFPRSPTLPLRSSSRVVFRCALCGNSITTSCFSAAVALSQRAWRRASSPHHLPLPSTRRCMTGM